MSRWKLKLIFQSPEIKCLIFLCFQLISLLCQYGEGSKSAFYYNWVKSTNRLYLYLQVTANSTNGLLKKLYTFALCAFCWYMSLKVTFAGLTPPWFYLCVSEESFGETCPSQFKRPSSRRVVSVLQSVDKVLTECPDDRMTHKPIIFMSSRTHSFVLGSWP